MTDRRFKESVVSQYLEFSGPVVALCAGVSRGDSDTHHYTLKEIIEGAVLVALYLGWGYMIGRCGCFA